MYHYLSLDYVYNQVREGIHKLTLQNQTEINFKRTYLPDKPLVYKQHIDLKSTFI